MSNLFLYQLAAPTACSYLYHAPRLSWYLCNPTLFIRLVLEGLVHDALAHRVEVQVVLIPLRHPDAERDQLQTGKDARGSLRGLVCQHPYSFILPHTPCKKRVGAHKVACYGRSADLFVATVVHPRFAVVRACPDNVRVWVPGWMFKPRLGQIRPRFKPHPIPAQKNTRWFILRPKLSIKLTTHLLALVTITPLPTRTQCSTTPKGRVLGQVVHKSSATPLQRFTR